MGGTVHPGWWGMSLPRLSRAPEAPGAWQCLDPAGAAPGGLGVVSRDPWGCCVPGTSLRGPQRGAEGGAGCGVGGAVPSWKSEDSNGAVSAPLGAVASG